MVFGRQFARCNDEQRRAVPVGVRRTRWRCSTSPPHSGPRDATTWLLPSLLERTAGLRLLQARVEKIVVRVLLVLSLLRTTAAPRFARNQTKTQTDRSAGAGVAARDPTDERASTGSRDTATSNGFGIGILRIAVIAGLLRCHRRAIVVSLTFTHALLRDNKSGDKERGVHQNAFTLMRCIAFNTGSDALPAHSVIKACVALCKMPVLNVVALAFAAA